MYDALPPGCYASAVMCEEHSIVPFFFNFKSFVFGIIFFSLLLSTLLGAVPVSSLCLFVCLFLSVGSEIQICLLFFLSIYTMEVRRMVISQYVFSGRFRF